MPVAIPVPAAPNEHAADAWPEEPPPTVYLATQEEIAAAHALAEPNASVPVPPSAPYSRIRSLEDVEPPASQNQRPFQRMFQRLFQRMMQRLRRAGRGTGSRF
eukprot:TRINITY_DN233_c0_g1_i7.p5 TRINITY_DN233_c0_g1~~TRINITY_DN233_c0_g1_i7.p5  ORF type:complete len:103 (+),score=22.22 TRINITY_DN233_c0_g1_i7:584-892(+)